MVPQAVQELLVDNEDVLGVSGEEVLSGELAEQIVVHRQIPVDNPEETGSTDPNPVLTTIDETGLKLVISFGMPNFSRRRQLNINKHISLLMRNTLIKPSW